MKYIFPFLAAFTIYVWILFSYFITLDVVRPSNKVFLELFFIALVPFIFLFGPASLVLILKAWTPGPDEKKTFKAADKKKRIVLTVLFLLPILIFWMILLNHGDRFLDWALD